MSSLPETHLGTSVIGYGKTVPIDLTPGMIRRIEIDVGNYQFRLSYRRDMNNKYTFSVFNQNNLYPLNKENNLDVDRLLKSKIQDLS